MSPLVSSKQGIVGVADLGVARAPGQLITYALGSCIGVTLFDPITKVGGMLHFMLPQPSEDTERGFNQAMYGTTGVPLLWKQVLDAGAQKARLIVCVAGGAEILASAQTFAIGKRNFTTLRKIFWRDGTVVAAEDVGGTAPRTMTLDLSTGEVRVRNGDKEKVLWQPGASGAPGRAAPGGKP